MKKKTLPIGAKRCCPSVKNFMVKHSNPSANSSNPFSISKIGNPLLPIINSPKNLFPISAFSACTFSGPRYLPTLPKSSTLL